MYFIRLDVHKKTISSCVKDAAGRVHQDGERETTPAVCQDTEATFLLGILDPARYMASATLPKRA